MKIIFKVFELLFELLNEWIHFMWQKTLYLPVLGLILTKIMSTEKKKLSFVAFYMRKIAPDVDFNNMTEIWNIFSYCMRWIHGVGLYMKMQFFASASPNYIMMYIMYMRMFSAVNMVLSFFFIIYLTVKLVQLHVDIYLFKRLAYSSCPLIRSV